MCLKTFRFRPLLGAYFFIRAPCSSFRWKLRNGVSVPFSGLSFLLEDWGNRDGNDAQFPSPVWGLFFYTVLETVKVSKGVAVSVPCSGLIFSLHVKRTHAVAPLFPSPTWGLVFK